MTVRAVAVHQRCQMAFSATAMHFAAAGEKQAIELRNLSHGNTGTCIVTAVDAADGFALESPFQPQLLRAGASLTVVVSAQRDWTNGTLTARADEGVATSIPLSSRFRPPDPSCLLVDEEIHSFGTVRLGCTASKKVSLSNTCNEPITIDLELSSDAYEVVGGARVFSMPPFSPPVELEVVFRPMSDVTPSQTLAVYSREPDGREFVQPVSLIGYSGVPKDVVSEIVYRRPRVHDVLIVVDDSPSMAARSAQLETELRSYFWSSDITCQNARVGVVRGSSLTGALESSGGSNQVISSFRNPNFAAQLAARLNGIAYTGPDAQQTLGAAVAAIQNPANSSLQRPEADRSVLLFTDADDTSAVPVGALQSLLPSNGSLVVVAPTASPPASCGADAMTAGSRLDQALAAFLPRQVWRTDVCANAWFQLGSTGGLCPLTSFTLQGEPIYSTISVVVDGVVQPDTAWVYDQTTRAISFSPLDEPADGATVEFHYTVRCD